MNNLPFEMKEKIIGDVISEIQKNRKDLLAWGVLPTLFCMYPREFIRNNVKFDFVALNLAAAHGGRICPEFFIEYLYNSHDWSAPLYHYRYFDDEYRFVFGDLNDENIKGNFGYKTPLKLPKKSEMFERLLEYRKYNKNIYNLKLLKFQLKEEIEKTKNQKEYELMKKLFDSI